MHSLPSKSWNLGAEDSSSRLSDQPLRVPWPRVASFINRVTGNAVQPLPGFGCRFALPRMDLYRCRRGQDNTGAMYGTHTVESEVVSH